VRRLVPFAVAALLATAGSAWAQGADTTGIRIAPGLTLPPGVRTIRLQDLTLLHDAQALDAEPAVSQRPIAPLTPEQQNVIREARMLRSNGQFDRAKAGLAPLRAALPVHPIVVTELARVLLAERDFAGAERLTRTVRLATRDSLVAGRELCAALQGLNRRRDAAGVALECLLAGPGRAEWAPPLMETLAAAEPKAARESLRQAMAKAPRRTDLALLAARIEWLVGDDKTSLRLLADADRPGAAGATPVRWTFAEQVIRGGAPRDSTGAANALASLAGDAAFDAAYRISAARRALEIERLRGGEARMAPSLARALRDVPMAQWPPEFVVALSRGLRAAGQAEEARTLLRAITASRGESPELDLEQALGELRDGPPERALAKLHAASANSEEARFRYAEALFFSGLADSALAGYQLISLDPRGAWAGAALERIYLLEDAQPRTALPAFGRMAWEEWRGQPARAAALADSLARGLPRGALWAHASVQLAGLRDRLGDTKGALAAYVAVADSLPDDRLAPLARQRAGDLYLTKLKDERNALAQYEECLARYPRAWNAAEVRRKVEQLRRERRF
jgi:thioredoxin-like negative regulator of GroEL